jgi:hypothetical protein
MFSDPLFTALDIDHARYVAPFDVALNPDSPSYAAMDAWLAAAQAAGVQPLVAFEHPAGDNCPDDPCARPNAAEYLTAFLAFRAKWPQVTQFETWNEANHPSQPTYRDPLVAASYYNAMAQHCSGCTIVAADLLDSAGDRSKKVAVWLRSFARGAPTANLWGLHNWNDVNRFTTDGINAVLNAVKGDVWLTETGGIDAFTSLSGTQSFKPSPARAVRAMNYLFQRVIPVSKRIKRVYVYNWLSEPTNRWDSGLTDHNGQPRGTYDVLKKYATGG